MATSIIEPRRLKDPVIFLACGFGSGLAPKAPGTFGTLAAVPIYLLFAELSIWGVLGLILLSFAVGVYLCDEAARRLGVHDHPGIVWDEFVGFWITMIAAPAGWWWIIVGFVLFRLFDIWKPWPIKIADQKVHNGLGIMLDDVLAGVYAWIGLQAIATLV